MSESLKSFIVDKLIQLDEDQLVSVLNYVQKLVKGESVEQTQSEPIKSIESKTPKKRRVKNPYSLASRLGQVMRSLSEPKTVAEILDIMKKLPGAYRPTDTLDAIRVELRRQRISSYHEVEVDTWIHQSMLKKNQAA